jgi:hypothetical protein
MRVKRRLVVVAFVQDRPVAWLDVVTCTVWHAAGSALLVAAGHAPA